MIHHHNADAVIPDNAIPDISTEDYSYILPPERIALYPLSERDASKLLVADLRNGNLALRHRIFSDLPEELPAESLLVMNDSRVIAARLPMQKASGGKAEVLCLHPLSGLHAQALQAQERVQWRCMLGGRNIHSRDRLHCTISRNAENSGGNSAGSSMRNAETITLYADILSKNNSEADVEFHWIPAHLSFGECLEACGHIPLPPYMKRADEAEDRTRYQTVYAAFDGSVAAPTAGLHFTERVLQALRLRGIREARVTLHVGAGTFKPMTGSTARHHIMHEERILVEKRTILALHGHALLHERTGNAPVIAVGTTSLRTLESLYWWGVRCIENKDRENTSAEALELSVHQWAGFGREQRDFSMLPRTSTALAAVLCWMEQHDMETLQGATQLMIVPGYRFCVCQGLITNFHQPHSTLILLVAAFLSEISGNDTRNSGTLRQAQHWKTVYNEALAHHYRFLSYGDSSLLWRKGER